MAARPKTLWAGAAPVFIGGAMAYDAGAFHAGAFVAALLGAVLIQVATNYHNDWCDFARGTDTEDRKGPTRATQAGLVAPRTMRNASALLFALVFVPGAYLILRGGWPMLAIGVLSILFGVLYTAGPAPLAYTGLADAFALVFFGPVAVGGTYWVQANALPWEVMVAGLAPGLLATALLTVNNLRDIDEDRAAGKKTLAVRFGPVFARLEYLTCVVGACIAVPLALYLETADRLLLAAALITMGYATPSVRRLYDRPGTGTLNAILAGTGKLLLVYSLAFSAAWLL
jgi:1,4-dihydroxy-2-naphthoate octaprenyltransferase